MADREPMPQPGRPTGDMPAQPTPQPPAADTTSHATHDVQLLASVADHDHDLDPATRATLDAMVAACDQCAEIAADLRFLATGLADLPIELPAPRDFRLLPEEAARARRGGIWRTLLRPFGVDGLPGLQPLAGTLAALGLVGLLLTSFPLGLGTSGAALAPERNGAGNYDTGAGAPGPAGSPDLAIGQDAAGSGAPAAGSGGKGEASSAPPQALESAPSAAFGPGGTARPGSVSRSESSLDQRPPPLPILSVALLIAGLALLSLGLAARRFG